MTVKEHYDKHLANFYPWMIGDFRAKCDEYKNFLIANAIKPSSNKMAVDLGAGNGLQSIPLAESGFQVVAIDFSQSLLDELARNAEGLPIKIINGDIRKKEHFVYQPELIICCGDTLSHLDNKSEVKDLISDMVKCLSTNGKLILSFRDYATELLGEDRFIHVKSDSNRILTCILDYEDEFLIVTDLLYEKNNENWIQKVSSYKKVRLLKDEIVGYLGEYEMKIVFEESVYGLTTLIAQKSV